jgi:hypothetical protein
MIPRRSLLIFGLLLSAAAHGQTLRSDPDQSTLTSLANRSNDRNWVVKFAPLSLFDPDNTVQFGVERLLGRQHAVQAEFGYGPQGMNLWQNNQNRRYSSREVWRGRAEYRYYMNRDEGLIGPYVAVEGLFKQVNARESGTIGIGCETGMCQYYQMFTAPVSKSVWAGHIKIGRQFSVSPNDRLLIDFYTGLGFRRSHVERFGRPGGVYYYRSAGYNLFDTFTPQTHAVVSMSYGVKIGYTL